MGDIPGEPQASSDDGRAVSPTTPTEDFQWLRAVDALRAALDAAPDYALLLDVEGRIQYANRYPDGLAPEVVLGKPATQFVPPELVARFEQSLRRVAETRCPTQLEIASVGLLGQPAWYDCRVGAIVQHNEHLGFVIFAADVTDRNRKDRELRAGEERLAEAQRIAGIGSWEWNVVTGEVWWSDELYRMCGHDPTQFRPSYEAFLEMVMPEDRPLVQARLQATLERDERYVLTYRAQNSQGVTRVFSAQARLHRDQEGNPWRLIGTCQDVTEQRRIQMQLRRTERLAALGTLAAGIAHEINNPMSAAWTAAETAKMLRGKPGSESLFEECLNAVSDAVCRSQLIIENVLRFARQESSRKEPQDLNDVVARAVETTAHYAQRHGSVVELDLTEKLPHPTINAPEMEQVLVNLIRNAVHAGSATRIGVSTESGFQSVRVRVTDNGRGIADADLDHIFDPFFTTGNDARGTGLGLAISHGIVEDHEGTIEVESQLGVGTTFVVSLPLIAPDMLKKPPHFRRGRKWLDASN